MTQRTLRPGEHRVVVGQHRARAAVHQPVGRCLDDEVGEGAAALLSGGDEPAVLDERPRIDEVGDVLPGRAPAGVVAASHRFGAGVVLGQRASPQQFGVVVAEVLGVGHG